MRDFNETNATEAFLARLDTCADPRLARIIGGFARHLHAFIREIRPTQAEWGAAISFLTRTGQISDDKRQEFVLLSDVMAVSMLVDAINHDHPGVTESTVLGPFHVDGAPLLPLGSNISLDGRGQPCVVSGRVLDDAGRPIGGAVLDVWQTTEDGWYDVQQPGIQPEGNLRGKFRAEPDGSFWFVSVKPASYPIPTDGPVGELLRAIGRHPFRPAHIHFIISAPGYESVTTHIFAEGDPYLDSDTVFGVKSSLVETVVESHSSEDAARHGVTAPFWRVSHEFRLAPLARADAAAATAAA
jgi:catechol 1,2-dioxygenase